MSTIKISTVEVTVPPTGEPDEPGIPAQPTATSTPLIVQPGSPGNIGGMG